MSAPDAWKRLGAVMAVFGSADDRQVGKALEQADAILGELGMTWAQLGVKVSAMGTGTSPSSAPDPRRGQSTNGGRPKSQWAVDREDVVKLFEHISQEGAPSEWVEQFAASLHDWVVGQGRGISERQREILHEKLDQLGL